MIRATITKIEFEKLTWMNFDAIASNMNEIEIETDGSSVTISVLGEELKTMSVENYNAILKG